MPFGAAKDYSSFTRASHLRDFLETFLEDPSVLSHLSPGSPVGFLTFSGFKQSYIFCANAEGYGWVPVGEKTKI